MRQIVRRFAWALIGFMTMGVILTMVNIVVSNRDLTQQVHDQADRNAEIVDCVVDYAMELTDSLQDRDAVNSTSRAAAIELWQQIERLVRHPEQSSAEDLYTAIDRYQAILKRITYTAKINPYPDVADCLRHADAEMAAFVLSAYHRNPQDPGRPGRWDNTCLGKAVTIRGTFGPDVVHGTDGPDVIFTYWGDDLVVGGKGNDRICTRGGDDTVNAGKDSDRVDCGRGDDFALQSELTYSC